MSEKLDGYMTAKNLDLSGKENLDIAYMYFVKNTKTTITEEEFHTYTS